MGNIFGKQQQCRILMMGLDASGKTTILYRMKLGELVTTIPSIAFNVETITHKNIKITCWDVGGRDKMRPLLRCYYLGTDVLIYIIDSNDHDRMNQAKEELQRSLSEDELQEVTVAVFANKQDLANARTLQKIVETLELTKIKQNWCIFPTTGTTGDGVFEAFDWIANQMATKRTKTSLMKPIKETAEGITELAADGKKQVQYGLGYFMGLIKGLCGSKKAVIGS